MDVCRVLLQFLSVILITRARIYQVLCFEENNVFITIDNYALSRDELMPTSYHFEKRSADDDPPIKKAIQNEKKSIQKSSTSSQYQKKLASHIKTIADTVSVVQNTTESNTTSMTISPTSKLGKEKYETNFSSDTTAKVSTSSSSTTSIATTAEPVVTTLIPDVPPTRPSNITNATVDHHIYYNSTFFLEEDKAMTFWVNFEKLPKSKVTKHFMLSDSHRRAATVTLSFDFPFYGHHLRNITIATGGFLYMGDYMHSWLAATQYVAPLMANFDTSLSNDSTVQYYDNGTAFVIEWNEVALQDEKQGGNFTFQATLLSNGNIVFVYRSIPVSVKEIGDESHPVKVGLSDAYVVDRVIYSCLNFKNCSSCMNANIGLDCVWCEAAKRCSDGLDRHRQHWLQQRCDIEKSAVKCNLFPSTDLNPVVQPYTEMPPKTHTMHSASESHDSHLMPAGPSFKQNIHEDDEVISQRMKVGDEQGPVGVGGVVSILLILGLLGGVMAWIGYAYRNPHTSSGQLLIRYRPSQWRFRSGEARYTAASVHM